MATVELRAGALRIVRVDRAAYELRVRPGHSLADARAMVPELVTYDDDPAADRCQLETLAIGAGRFSPIVHIEGDDSLVLDVTGCERLFEGEGNLLDQVIDSIRDQGFCVRGAVADTPGGAWAMSHAHEESAVISRPGEMAADLVPLPVWSLRIDPKTVKTLSLIGIETTASLLHLPRSSLASRFGDALLDRIDRALGDVPEVLTPYRPQPALTSRIRFGAGTMRLDVLTEAIHLALDRFCGELTRRVAGVRQMFVTFYCVDPAADRGNEKRTVTLPVNLSRPTRSAKHLGSLATVLLDKLHLPAPAESLMVWARRIDSLDGRQEELFATEPGDARQLGDLVDRLAVRLGSEAVVRAEAVDEHQPERAYRYVPMVRLGRTHRARATGLQSRGVDTSIDRPSTNERPRRVPIGSGQVPPVDPSDIEHPRRLKPAARSSTEPPRGLKPAARGESAVCLVEEDRPPPGPRPLLLSPRPVEVAATALVPDGPPIAFRLHGAMHTVVESIGPERIETGWWRGPHLKRDYYRVATEDRRRCWLFRERDGGRWFLHGWFD